jgi:hypothetical protein
VLVVFKTYKLEEKQQKSVRESRYILDVSHHRTEERRGKSLAHGVVAAQKRHSTTRTKPGQHEQAVVASLLVP